MTCAIIDDEPLAAALLESYVKKTPFLEHSGTFANAIDAMAVLSKAPVDLLFLDIQMPELSGLEFAKLIPSTTRIIFTTAFSQYAIEGYKVNAFDYLLKPISYADFLTFNVLLVFFVTGGDSLNTQFLTSQLNEVVVDVAQKYGLNDLCLDRAGIIEDDVHWSYAHFNRLVRIRISFRLVVA